MALHIQMSDEALRKLKKDAFMSKAVSFGICFGMLLLFGSILYFTVMIIQGEIPTEFVTYVPPAEDGPPTNAPVSKELTSKSVSTNPTVTPSVIVAQNAVGPVAAPVSIDTTGDLSFDQLDMSMDMSVGDGLGSGGSGMGSSAAGGSALEGTFYDLKLARDGNSPSSIMKSEKNQKVTFYKVSKDKKGITVYAFNTNQNEARYRIMEKVHDFFTMGNKGAFSPFYSSPQKLYASSFYVPETDASYATYAYQCRGVCQPSGWVCVYRGTVRAPKSGKFRFVGVGDDFLGVKFNNKVVLESGYMLPSLWKKDDMVSFSIDAARMDDHWAKVRRGEYPDLKGYIQIKPSETPLWNQNIGGLTAGKVFEVKEGETYPIQILVSEVPGGGFGYCLFIEDVTDMSASDLASTERRKFDLFRTNFSSPNEKEIAEQLAKAGAPFWNNKFQLPPFNPDSPIWTAVP